MRIPRRRHACSPALLHGHAGASVRAVRPDDSHGTSGYGGQRGGIRTHLELGRGHIGNHIKERQALRRAPHGRRFSGRLRGTLPLLSLRSHGGLRSACFRSGILMRTGSLFLACQGVDFPAHGHELKFPDEVCCGPQIERLHGQFFKSYVLTVLPRQLRQPAPEEHILKVILQFLLEFRGQEGKVIADGLEPRADSENLLHRFGAYAGNTGNIVHGISGERLHIGLKIGTKPVFFLVGLGRDQFFLL